MSAVAIVDARVLTMDDEPGKVSAPIAMDLEVQLEFLADADSEAKIRDDTR